MSQIPSRKAVTELTPDQLQKLQRQRDLVAAELPDLIERDRMRKEAQDEPTLSGALRRAVHESELSLRMIAERAGMAPLALDEFLTGERTLRSDVLDRLANVLGRTVSLTSGSTP